MGTGTWQLDWLRIAGLAASAVLLLGGMWLLWTARHRADAERVMLPALGRVGVPTCLTLGVCALAAGYHILAYSLLPRFTLWSVPIERWWVVAGVIAVAIVGSLTSEWLESRHDEPT